MCIQYSICCASNPKNNYPKAKVFIWEDALDGFLSLSLLKSYVEFMYRFWVFILLFFFWSHFNNIVSNTYFTLLLISHTWVWMQSTLHSNNHDNAKVIHLVNNRHRIFPREFHGLFEVLCDIIVELDVGFYKCPFWSHILNRLWVCFVYFCSLLKPLIEFNTNFILLLMSLDVHRNNPLLNLLKLNFLIES